MFFKKSDLARAKKTMMWGSGEPLHAGDLIIILSGPDIRGKYRFYSPKIKKTHFVVSEWNIEHV